MPGEVSQPRSSPTARAAFVAALLLAISGSLFPASDWTSSGVSPFAWVAAPLPRYWTLPEVVWNVLAYVPLALLLAWALHPRWRGASAVLIATAGCALVSASLESLQTYLPSRVASNLDFVANTAGAALGALVGAASAGRLIDTRKEVHWGERILRPRTHAAVILCALWVLAQVPPQPMLFGTGDVLSVLGGAAWRLETWFPAAAQLPPIWRARAEQTCTALAVVGVSLLMMHCLRPFRWRALLIPLFVLLALGVKAMAQPLAPPGGPPVFSWLTPGAWNGLLMGMAMAVALSALSPGWQRGLALIALACQVLLVNFVPADRYFEASMASGRVGLLNLEALLAELARLWPYAACAWMLFAPGSRRARRAPAPAET